MSISSLPKELQEEIFLRLPVKSILCFRSVCRSWYKNMSSLKFVMGHLNLAKRNPRIMIRDAALMCYNYDDMFYSIDYASILSASTSSSLTTCECNGAVQMDHPRVKRKYRVEESRFIHILGSCNGLLCLGASTSDSLIIWNPSTKEYKEIMLPPPVNKLWSHSFGFGYDSKINDYKLVCASNQANEVYVYTLTKDSWRRVDTIPLPYGYLNLAGLFLNGALHWTSIAGEKTNSLVSFDISSEKFMDFPFPKEIILDAKDDHYLGVLGDSLCLVYGVTGVLNDRVDVWVMETYGERESWTKLFTTAQESTLLAPRIKPFWSLKNGEIPIQDSRGFVLYDQKNDKIRFLKFNGIHGFGHIDSYSYIESLVSLKSGTYTEKRSHKRKRDPDLEY